MYGDEILFLDPAEQFDKCIVGVASRCGMNPVLVYDEELVVKALVEDGLTEEEAAEWFDFNIAGAYVGETTPMFMRKIDDGVQQ